jgi:8-oxo-dGTP pyrophosphatase MutT (NUDIX family)
MELVFSDQPFPKSIRQSIFLAGPSPRNNWDDSWRYEAIRILEDRGFDGTVFIPVPFDKWNEHSTDEEKITAALVNDSPPFNYDHQIWWELQGRRMADVILFWVDRDVSAGRLALTTNIEFGEDLSSGKMIYGRPKEAKHCRYMDLRYMNATGHPLTDDLGDLIEQAMFYSSSPTGKRQDAQRTGGEVYVPVMIWASPQFQSWYKAQLAVGNRLEDADVKYVHHTRNHGDLFAFIIQVSVYVAAEDRIKDNEFVFSRKDISSIIPYYQTNTGETFVVLVKEFRSPVRNASGYVYELAGGSSVDPVGAKENAALELKEELGITIDDHDRFEFVSERQLCATLCSHTSSVYAIRLDWKEYTSIIQSAYEKKSFGIQDDSEITYAEIIELKDITKLDLDYSMLGMILSYFHNK